MNSFNYCKSLLKIKCSVYGDQSREVADLLKNFGDFFKGIDKEKSLKFYHEMIEIYARLYTENSEEVALGYFSLGSLMMKYQDPSCEIYFDKADKIKNEVRMNNNPQWYELIPFKKN